MTDKLASPAKASTATANTDDDDDDDGGNGRQVEKLSASRSNMSDPFARAAAAAEKELSGEPDKKAKPKAKPAPKAEDDDDDDEPAEKVKPKAKVKAKPAADDGDDDEDDGDDADEADSAAKKVKKAKDAKAEPENKPASTEPLKAKAYWPKERRDNFEYVPRETQEAWLAETPTPHAHWPTEQKELFAKQPREVQDAWLTQNHALERGFEQKFQGLAAERKLAEAIRNAVPANIREVMTAKNLDEPSVFAGLLKLQQQSMADPIGYMRDFIVKNKVDLKRLLDDAGSDTRNSQQDGKPADIESHPAYRALKGEVEQLKGHVTSELKRREEESYKQVADDIGSVVAERDEGGELRYPYARLLAPAMSQILEADPERLGSMGVKERFAETYRLALEAHPELKQIQRTAKPDQDDDSDDEDAHSDEDAEAEKLKRAATKKSKTPQSAPGGKSRDAFDEASRKANKTLGKR